MKDKIVTISTDRLKPAYFLQTRKTGVCYKTRLQKIQLPKAPEDFHYQDQKLLKEQSRSG